MRRTTDLFRAFRRGALLIGVLASIGAAPLAAQQEFQVDLEATNRVTFVSRAAIEQFEGVTSKIDGYVLLDTERLEARSGTGATEFYFEVDLVDLDTGIGLRNRHMRDNYLEVEDYPYATFEGGITPVEDTSSGYRFRAEGVFGLHGVEREKAVPCQANASGDGYRVRCEFTTRLSDHDIEIPKIMFLKLAEAVRVLLDFHVTPVGEDRHP